MRRVRPGLRHLFWPGQVVRFERHREYFPVGSTPASLPARLSNQTTCPCNQSFACLNDVALRVRLLPEKSHALFVSATQAGYAPEPTGYGFSCPGRMTWPVYEGYTVERVLDKVREIVSGSLVHLSMRNRASAVRAKDVLRIKPLPAASGCHVQKIKKHFKS